MKCPICLRKVKKPTREHLPFKGLYKNLSDKQQDNAAVIKICSACNWEKSIWDQEFLAVFGHLLDVSKAKFSQRSLKKFKSVQDALSVCLTASRAAHTTGEPVVKRYNLPCDLVTQWFWMCGRGIYYFFERKPFNGSKVFIFPHVLDHNTQASKFVFYSSSTSDHEGKSHKINESCWIWMMRRGNQSPMVAMSIINQKTDRIFSVRGMFIECDSQIERNKAYAKTLSVDSRPFRIANARDIFDISRSSDGGWGYKGIKQIK